MTKIHDSTTCQSGPNNSKCDMCEFAEESAQKHAELPSESPALPERDAEFHISEAKNVPSGQETPGIALPALSVASPWALENGHKIARLLQYYEGPPYNIPAILDEALAPVRECLEGLRNSHGCWCPGSADYEFEPPFVCGPSCLAAQQLYERLKTRE